MKQFASGAKSSEEAPRYDLIPAVSLRRQAARMAEGAQSHGERNFEKGAADPVFVRDRINHLVGHALAYAAGDTSDDHLGAVLANAGMLARLEELKARVSHDERMTESQPCPQCQTPTYPGPRCVGCRRSPKRRAQNVHGIDRE